MGKLLLYFYWSTVLDASRSVYFFSHCWTYMVQKMKTCYPTEASHQYFRQWIVWSWHSVLPPQIQKRAELYNLKYFITRPLSVFLTSALSDLISLLSCELSLMLLEEIPSSVSPTPHWAGSLHCLSFETHQGQLLLLLFYFIIDERPLWWHSTFCTFRYIDGKVTAYFHSTNLGAGMKCQLRDTNIPHCAPACRSREHPADSDLIKMHWREQLYDFQAKW